MCSYLNMEALLFQFSISNPRRASLKCLKSWIWNVSSNHNQSWIFCSSCSPTRLIKNSDMRLAIFATLVLSVTALTLSFGLYMILQRSWPPRNLTWILFQLTLIPLEVEPLSKSLPDQDSKDNSLISESCPHHTFLRKHFCENCTNEDDALKFSWRRRRKTFRNSVLTQG